MCGCVKGCCATRALRSSYGGVEAFYGPAATVKCHECTTLVRKALEGAADGHVRVLLLNTSDASDEE